VSWRRVIRPRSTNLTGQRESPAVLCVVVVDAVDRPGRRQFAASLRLQIYCGLGIEPILNDCGELDHVLVGRWHFYVNFCAINWTKNSSPSHNIHLVKFGPATLDEDLVEQICSP